MYLVRKALQESPAFSQYLQELRRPKTKLTSQCGFLLFPAIFRSPLTPHLLYRLGPKIGLLFPMLRPLNDMSLFIKKHTCCH